MKGWTLEDVQDLPRDVYAVIVEELNRAADQQKTEP